MYVGGFPTLNNYMKSIVEWEGIKNYLTVYILKNFKIYT